MKLESVEIKNFRALNNLMGNQKVNIHENITLLVGKNNVGKTSFTHLFYLFINGKKFEFEDFSLNSYSEFESIFRAYCELKNEDEKSEFLSKDENRLPSIQLKLKIAYSEEDNFSKILPLITSLKMNNEIEVLFSYEANNESMLLEKLKLLNDSLGEFNLISWLQKNLIDNYSTIIMPYSGGEYREQIDIADIKKIINVHHIMAQRSLEDGNSQTNSKLSPVFRNEYKFKKNQDIKNEETDVNDVVINLEKAITKRNEEIDEELKGFFKEFLESYSTFGFPNIEGADLTLKSHVEATDVFKGIQFFYKTNEHLLPEKYNGLGFSNLIYIISDLLSFRNRASVKDAELNLIFIEEPEAHMHPQLQTVFIKKMNEFLMENSINAQVVISTHSSSIVSSSKFQNIKYFCKNGQSVKVKDLAEFKVEIEGDERSIFKFLEQYISVVNCEMFFADKIIMIEGSVERLLMPLFVQKVDGFIKTGKKLSEQYISVIEVGGAYMHKFKEFLEFINVKTLIVTDIDCCKLEYSKKAKRDVPKKHEIIEKEKDQLITTNPVLKDWIPGKESIKNLLERKLNIDEKVIFNVTYQNEIFNKESGITKCGRSFEEAFIIENTKFLLKNKVNLASVKNKLKNYSNEECLLKDSYEVYDFIDRNEKKTDFAFDLMTYWEDWEVPCYIKEGLEWLAR
ncbi:ATP-dependent nuclease [Bacillus mycoides]|uniref:ATP-dependent nuclease n=1 Tax=Bacillus mycoides TaxID=1405 RepID=UPI003CFE30D2